MSDNLSQYEWELPEYITSELAPRQSKYCVCIFVIKEGKKIRAQLESMQAICQNIDLIIADGGSTDNSLELDFLSSTLAI